MTPWTRRLIGPGRNPDAAPTQPLEDTPAAAHGCWVPFDVLSQETSAIGRIIALVESHERASRWLARCVIAAVAAFVLFVAWGGGGA